MAVNQEYGMVGMAQSNSLVKLSTTTGVSVKTISFTGY